LTGALEKERGKLAVNFVEGSEQVINNFVIFGSD